MATRLSKSLFLNRAIEPSSPLVCISHTEEKRPCMSFCKAYITNNPARKSSWDGLYYAKVGGKTAAGSAADYASMADGAKVASWAVPAVGWCFKSKILSGSNGKINPQGNATRAEAAKMVVGLHDLLG